MRAAVERFRSSARATRIFNHSINAYGYCRLRHMSSWAAEIDAVSAQYDVLVVQSAGNLSPIGPQSHPGIEDHLNAGREYPAYLCEPASRISSPAQSLQALTVGSVGYGAYSGADWRSFVPAGDHPAAFSRSGPGIWDVLKPEVVEYGGDFVRSNSGAHDVALCLQEVPNAVHCRPTPLGPHDGLHAGMPPVAWVVLSSWTGNVYRDTVVQREAPTTPTAGAVLAIANRDVHHRLWDPEIRCPLEITVERVVDEIAQLELFAFCGVAPHLP
ncbi:S8 family serine peptidase [Variovorax paradoxus]|nr:S8 family serine peptidase [Variovorax paradoxus]